jgi:hypothetical protein
MKALVLGFLCAVDAAATVSDQKGIEYFQPAVALERGLFT